MLQKIHKLYCSYEKEEKWLNDMAAKGMILKNYSWCTYFFEKDVPGKYIYRIEILENLPSHPESKSYIEFLEDTGVEYVCSYMRWVYFRKKASEGTFDLYSDIDSRIKHYNRILKSFLAVFIINLMAMISNLIVGIQAMVDRNIYVNLGFAAMSFILSCLIGCIILAYKKKVKKLKKKSN
ncbi:DUF2812 domain-containing protein [[Clostridium] dakarense]|uniref:DUF2812 domain-containing protein n=1 Tax=Faecalimicrobium dakarense TaxID=1301100 RepID=UPI0004B50AD4|nr:DUF2812 domain-containing protein [[Clostridium] dakarense]